MIEILKRFIRAVVPGFLLRPSLHAYHFTFAALSALLFGFPSRSVTVIGVTGTKGKSSTAEYINAIFEAHGSTTALINSIRIKVADRESPNVMRMSMPGRIFLQKFLADARRADCDVVIMEMTSEGARQHRHRFIDLDALVFTNLAPEHIESHGSFEAYAQQKFELGLNVLRSSKRPRYIVFNADDPEGVRYGTIPVEHVIPFSLSQIPEHTATDHGGSFRFGGTDIMVPLPGEFSLRNALAAATVARAFGIPERTIANGIARVTRIPGRAEEVREGQDFAVVVDYAHTPDSLQAIYDAYAGRRRICVLGSTGGGRDKWKRPVMGSVAEKSCDIIILTNEDPYDEVPEDIVAEIASGIRSKKPEIIMDRREAIRRAVSLATSGDAVLITGKGTDPTIAGPKGTKIPWSDAQVAREEVRTTRV